MKKILIFVFGLLIYACAPVSKCKPYESASYNIPNSFVADGFVSYGILEYPISLVKAKSGYTLKSFIGDLNFKQGVICAYGTCINLPIDVSKLIYGDVVSKEDAISCHKGYTIYQGNVYGYTKKVYVKNGELYKMELLKPNKQKELSVYFKDKSSDGYYKHLELKNNSLDLDIYIKNLRQV